MPVIPVITPSQTPPDHLAIHITSIEAALLRLNIDVPIEDLIVVMREEELRLEAEKTERYISLSKSLTPRQHLAKESKSFPSPQSPPIPTSSTRNTAAASPTKRGLPAQRHGSKRSLHRSTLPVSGRSAPISAFAPSPQASIDQLNKGCSGCCRLIKQYNEAAFPNGVSTPTL
ncbi:hypothetical protein BJV77DRAFT_965682 [Russula vinacea]|nr:hypothetical protein BJV77DRAFT_965682 [Russula vinacea]